MESREDMAAARREHPAKQALKAAENALGAVGDDVTRRVESHPYRTLAVAFGAGYLLAGGLFSGLTARILGYGVRTGIRLAVLPLIEVELVRAAQDWALAEAQRGTNGHS